jgi:putative peptidoglycan lipid II flippase
VIVSMFTVVVNATLNIILVRVMGYAGLALGTSLAAIFNSVVLLVLLRRALGGLDERRIAGSLLRIAGASVAMGAAAAGVDAWLVSAIPGDALPVQIARVMVTIAAAVIVLAASAWMLRIREFKDAVAVIRRRLRRTR